MMDDDNNHDNEGGSSNFDTNEWQEQHDDANSLMSDHIDVDALLSHGCSRKATSPLATIKEVLRESSGYKSSQVSPDASVGDKRIGNQSFSRKMMSNDQNRAFEDSSCRGSDAIDQSVIKNAHNESNGFDVEEGTYGSDSDGYGQGSNSPMFDNNNGYSDDDDQVEIFHMQSRKKMKGVATKHECQLHKERRKTFPPGPLCSLQMLDLIADGSLNTPMWRNGKRKRCTLTSLKRSNMDTTRKMRRSSR
jgi:hypothetical protein